MSLKFEISRVRKFDTEQTGNFGIKLTPSQTNTLFASLLLLDEADFSVVGSSSLLITVGSSALASAGTMLKCSMFSEHATFTIKVRLVN